MLLHEPRPCSGFSQHRDPATPMHGDRCSRAGKQTCKTFYPLLILYQNQPHVTGQTETGKVLQGRTVECLQKPEIQEDRRSGMDMRNALSTERLEGRSPHCGCFELVTLQILQSLALTEKHEIAPDQALAILAK